MTTVAEVVSLAEKSGRFTVQNSGDFVLIYRKHRKTGRYLQGVSINRTTGWGVDLTVDAIAMKSFRPADACAVLGLENKR